MFFNAWFFMYFHLALVEGFSNFKLIVRVFGVINAGDGVLTRYFGHLAFMIPISMFAVSSPVVRKCDMQS